MDWIQASLTSFPTEEGWYMAIVKNEKEEYVLLPLYYSHSWHVPYHLDICYFSPVRDTPVQLKKQILF